VETSISDATLSVIGDLREPAASAAFWLTFAARQAGFPVIVTSGRRTPQEQARLVAAGLSRTLRSKHVEGLAFDIDWYRTSRDAVPAWFWELIGPWAEKNLGLTWGGRWSHPYDPGHFEVR